MMRESNTQEYLNRKNLRFLHKRIPDLFIRQFGTHMCQIQIMLLNRKGYFHSEGNNMNFSLPFPYFYFKCYI